MSFILLLLIFTFFLIHEVLENIIYDIFYILPYDFYEINKIIISEENYNTILENNKKYLH